MAFGKYSLSDGFTATLPIAPEGKFPVRKGTADAPQKVEAASAALP